MDIDRYPAIHEHLEWFRPQLEKRATAHLHPWYELQQPQEGIFAEFDRPKVIWPDITREVRFSFDGGGSYINDKSFLMPTDSVWLLAIMNSTLAEFLLCQIASTLRGGFLQMKRQYTSRLPILDPGSMLQNCFEAIALKGIAGCPTDAHEIDDMVYDLYGLSASDVALISDWFERRSLVD